MKTMTFTEVPCTVNKSFNLNFISSLLLPKLFYYNTAIRTKQTKNIPGVTNLNNIRCIKKIDGDEYKTGESDGKVEKQRA